MASSNACWGIELGAGAIKALKLVREGDENVRVEDFIVLPHKKVLSTPDLDQDEAMRVALGTLMSQYDLSKATIAISAPGHGAFLRFAPLPPVEPKKIDNIVKYEAMQQIPFPLEEVEWDYQTFTREDSPDVEVGIFAITRERVMERLNLCSEANLHPNVLNLSPVAVYSAMAYDMGFTENTEGTVIIDIGAVATDLIVADAGRVWVRTFPLGGHSFTEAVVNAFKLPYTKAEKLKREAEQSKHKRHIFQAMRPVYTDLGQEVQRSIAYYKQLHPESEIKRVIGLGSTFRLIGLRKYLSQQLQINVTRCESFRRLNVEGAAEVDFQSATLGMTTAYGLALQGLGLAAIDANLIPATVVREEVWKKKSPVFAAAAIIALAAGGASFIRPMLTSRAAETASSNPEVAQVRQIKNQGKQLRDQWQTISQSGQIGYSAENVLHLFDRRDLFEYVAQDVASMIATAPPTQPGGYELKDVRINYETPSGGSPKWIVTGGSGRGRNAAPARRSGGGGGGGGSMGGPGGGGSGSFSSSQRRSRRPGQSGQPAKPDQRFGVLDITMTVESDNPGLGAFVDKTLLAWLRDNADRPGSPYTFTTPSADDISIQEVDDESGDRNTPARASTPARSGSTAGAPGAAAATLDLIAPLPSIDTQVDDATRYQYTIHWRATLKEPDKVISLSTGDESAEAPSQEASQ